MEKVKVKWQKYRPFSVRPALQEARSRRRLVTCEPCP